MLVDEVSGYVKSIRDYDSSGGMLSRTPRDDRDPFGFTGGINAGNGLWKLGARFYDSGKGSFIQQDKYMGSPSDPLSLNRYVYCGLDPVNFVDPTGFEGEEVNKSDPPPEESGYEPPKGGAKKVKTADGKWGWKDSNGNIWIPVPTGSPLAHGGGHWDVQYPGGGYDNVYPDGNVRKGSGPRGQFSPPGQRIDIGVPLTVGGAAVAGYLTYRAIRMIPSLIPPLWGTIPFNLAIP